MTTANVDIQEVARPRVSLLWRPRRSSVAYLLLTPSLIFLFAFTYLPIGRALIESLTISGMRGKFLGYGLGNFERLFKDVSFHKAVLNSMIYAGGTILPSIIIALTLAVALQRSSRINALLRTIFFFPTLLPLVAAATLFMFVFMPGVGLLDYHLARLGIGVTNWLGNPDIALWSLVGLTVWKNAGYYMLFFLAGLQGISPDLYEAAKLDGAGPWTRFWRITLPLLKPTMAFVVVISLVYAVTQVDHIIVLTGGGPTDSTNVLLNYIFHAAHEKQDLGLGAAATVVSVVVLLGLSFLSMRALERGRDPEGVAL